MAFKIATVMQRNFLILIHSKLSSLIIILGPILLILLIGSGLSNSGIKDIRANVYTEEKTPFSDSFIDNLKGRSFIIEESGTLDECISGVRDSGKNICIQIKKSDMNIASQFNLSAEDINRYGIGSTIYLYADFSKQKIVWNIITKVRSSVEDFSSNIRGGAGIQLKQRLQDYSAKIKDERRDLQEAISILSLIETQITDLKTKLNSIQLSEIDSYINNIQGNINSLNVSHPDIVSLYNLGLFWQLKDAWDRGNYIQSYADIMNKINEFEINVRSAKDKLEKLDQDLQDLENNMDNLKNLNMDYILNPIGFDYESISGEISNNTEVQLENFDYLFPSFLSFFILFVSIVLSTNFTIKERTSKAKIRNTLSKALGFTFIIGNFLTILFIIFIQCMFIIFFSNYFLNIPLYSYMNNLIIIILISSSVFICLGMIIGYLFNSNETAMIASLVLSIFMIMFSPLINPLETLPDLFKTFIQYTPLVLTEEFLRKTLIYNSDISQNLSAIIILGTSFVISFILANIFYRFTKNKEIA